MVSDIERIVSLLENLNLMFDTFLLLLSTKSKSKSLYLQLLSFREPLFGYKKRRKWSILIRVIIGLADLARLWTGTGRDRY